MGRLHYRSLERAKVKNLKPSRGNFDKTAVLDGQSKLDILWWRDTIVNSHSPIIQGNPTTHIYTDASSYGWGGSCNSETCRGQFSTTEKELHTNILELKAALFGMKSFYKKASHQHVLIHIDNTSAIAAINKMGRMVSVEMDFVVHEI